MTEKYAAALKGLAMALLVAAITGCGRALPAGEFVPAYEREAMRELQAGDYHIRYLYQSVDYLVAREVNAGMKLADADRRRKDYAGGLFVGISIAPKAEAQTHEEAVRSDLLNGRIAEGEREFRDRLLLLQGKLGQYVRLEDSRGRRIPLSTYSFSRNFGLGSANSFLFAFPAEYQGEKLNPKELELVIEDFGLNTGTLRSRLSGPGSLKLRMQND
jgi:hypothetical protein